MKKTEIVKAPRIFINVVVRWPERKKVSKDELLKKRFIEEDDEFESLDEDVEYSYDEAVIDVDNIMNFNRYTNDLTVIRTYQQEAYMVKLPFDVFQKMYVDITGNKIYNFREDDDLILK